MITEPGPDPAAVRPYGSSRWHRATQILLVSSLALFVASGLAASVTPPAAVIALLLALAATGLALLAMLVLLIYVIHVGGNNT